MNLRKMNSGRKQPRGQGLLELALTLPIFLILVVGIMEVARLIFIYGAVFTASREGARYAASTDTISSGVPHYIDCAGIKDRVIKMAVLADLTASDIQINYDSGPGTDASRSCPVAAKDLALGDRIIVTASKTYTPLIPFIDFGSMPITSTTARTLIKDFDVNWIPPSP